MDKVDHSLAYSDKNYQNCFQYYEVTGFWGTHLQTMFALMGQVPIMHKSYLNVLPFRATAENQKFLILRFSAFFVSTFWGRCHTESGLEYISYFKNIHARLWFDVTI